VLEVALRVAVSLLFAGLAKGDGFVHFLLQFYHLSRILVWKVSHDLHAVHPSEEITVLGASQQDFVA